MAPCKVIGTMPFTLPRLVLRKVVNESLSKISSLSYVEGSGACGLPFRTICDTCFECLDTR